MSYWIFVVTSHEEHGVTGEDVLRQRIQDSFWGLGERTPNRKNLERGDSIVFLSWKSGESRSFFTSLFPYLPRLTESPC